MYTKEITTFVNTPPCTISYAVAREDELSAIASACVAAIAPEQMVLKI
jgi:hypothetical protein